jgi:hypothetical protein
MSVVKAKKKEVLMDTDKRFDRIEAKLDKLVDALSQLVAVETTSTFIKQPKIRD